MPRLHLPAAARILLAAAWLLTHPPPAAPQRPEERAFTSYGADQGMFSTKVSSLLQDEEGFLWIGTHAGLLRYDGRTFKAYRAQRSHPGDSTSLADGYIRALAPADSGRLWVGAQRGGLQRFDPSTGLVLHYPLTDLGPWRFDDAQGASEERTGRSVLEILPLASVVLIRTDVGLVRFDPMERSARLLMPAWDGPHPLPHATALARGPDGGALIAVSDGMLALVDAAGTISALPLALPDSAIRLVPLEEGYVATSVEGAVRVIAADLTEARLVLRLPREEGRRRAVRDLCLHPDGTLWVATTVGAFQADLDEGWSRRAGGGEQTRPLPDQEVSALLVDRTGVLWVGTWNGLASLHPLSGGMTRFYSGADLEGAGVVAVADAGAGRVWVGTDGGGIQLLRRREGVWVRPAFRPAALEPLARALAFGLAGGGGAPLWIAAFSEGVWVLEGEAQVRRVPVLDAEGVERNPTAYSVFVDHALEVWAGTLPLGLLRLDRAEGVFRPWQAADPEGGALGSDWVWPIAEDSRGRLWVGAFEGGLSVITADRSSATLHREAPGGLSTDRILSVFVDSGDRVWLGTEGGGLIRFDPGTEVWTTWTTQDGLPHDNVQAVREDGDGFLWVSTADGLVRMEPRTGELLVFREPAGLAGSRFYANPAYRDANGVLYFGGPEGLSIVDPTGIASQGVPPRAALTAFRIQGREAPLARAVRAELLDLAPDENFFAFEFAALDFTDPSQNRYRYRLEGLDRSWVDAAEPVANYTSVPPGHYTFRVAARNSEGIWNHDALALPIRVRAPYHKTLWFRTLVTLAGLSLVAGFYTYRLRQLEARQRLRLEIAGKLHDDIGANLSTIALKAEMVRGAPGLDERRGAQLADVGRLARETATKVRETVWVVNTRYDTVAGLVSKMHDTADTLLAATMPYGFTGPEPVPDRRISMEVRQNVHLLFKEVLNNIVKHARASRADITVRVEGPVLSLRVADDGVGFDPATAPEGNGRRLMEHRATALGATLRVTSAPGAGTTVDFTTRLR